MRPRLPALSPRGQWSEWPGQLPSGAQRMEMARRKWGAGFTPQSPEPNRAALKTGHLSWALSLGLPNTRAGRALGEEGREQATAQRCEAAWSGEEAWKSTRQRVEDEKVHKVPSPGVLGRLCPIGSKDRRGQVGLWRADSS